MKKRVEEQGKFRTLPIVVDAVRIKQRFPWPNWFSERVSANQIVTHGIGKFASGTVYATVLTHEGWTIAQEGDWVVSGPHGLYTCKDEIFRTLYKPVDEPSKPKGQEINLGDFVKIHGNGEAFWCIVEGFREEGLRVRVDSHVFNQPFEYGDSIVIQREDVIRVMPKETPASAWERSTTNEN